MSRKEIKEELERISPFMAKLEKTKPFTVPEGYFESIQHSLEAKIEHTPKELQMKAGFSNSLKYLAIAATLAGVFIAIFFLFRQPTTNSYSLADQLAILDTAIINSYLKENIQDYDDELLSELVVLDAEEEIIEIDFDQIDDTTLQEYLLNELSLDEVEQIFL